MFSKCLPGVRPCALWAMGPAGDRAEESSCPCAVPNLMGAQMLAGVNMMGRQLLPRDLRTNKQGRNQAGSGVAGRGRGMWRRGAVLLIHLPQSPSDPVSLAPTPQPTSSPGPHEGGGVEGRFSPSCSGENKANLCWGGGWGATQQHNQALGLDLLCILGHCQIRHEGSPTCPGA